ncbi:MAG: glycoside hydrolase family 15 protein [Actinomycetota bacterium]|nr:glycoside hydrolase family 15 protein [Actinomycetota bacterium]
MALPIEHYAIIGDTHTAALVGRDGSIDWLCMPRFDSPACFAALLGTENNGHWVLRPSGEVTSVRRSYRGHALLLETEFTTADGVVRLTDCMPIHDDRADIVRQVEGVQGNVPMEMELTIRFGYGRVVPWVRKRRDRRTLVAIAGPDAICLRGNVVPESVGQMHRAEFTISPGEVLDFSMTWFPSHDPVPPPYDTTTVIATTEEFWKDWAGHCTYQGAYHEAVLRSLIALKAMTYEPTGGMVAAVTTSLPEQFGGPRNWDYRFCWLRDASLTLWALLANGFRDEAQAWRRWLLRAVAGDPADLQILYGVAGERHVPEYELDWLPGYENSRPVRVGNAAAAQYQADVVGEVMDALQEARRMGLVEDQWSWPLQRSLMGYLEANWERPDSGIWEVRGPLRYFTHSRVMVWVAFDRAVRACESYALGGPVERWRELRDQVFAEVMEKGWNDELGTFTQYYGGTTVDASLLLISHMGFLPPDHPRLLGTIAAVERQLKHGIFVDRYITEPDPDGQTVDGLPTGEYAFLACSFWLVGSYARAGRTAEAKELFEALLDLANDVGLMAEEYNEPECRMAGNFPQAFSHLALVDAAHSLAAAGEGTPRGS